MLTILQKNVARNVYKPKDVSITSPFSVSHNKFSSDDCSTTGTISWRHSTFVLRYSRFTSPKHQAQLKLGWPVNRKDRVILLCRPISTRHIKYHVMHELLPCPLQLSACIADDIHQCHSCSRNSAALTLLCWHLYLCEHSHPGES